MKVDIIVPEIGESVTEGTIASILKQSGEYVQKNDEIIEIETDKVNQVLYAQEAGVVSFDVTAGTVVKVGQKIGSIDTDAKASDGAEPPKTAAQAEETPKDASVKDTAPPKQDSKSETRVFADSFVSSLKEEPKDLSQETKEELTPNLPKQDPSAKSPEKPVETGVTRKKMSSLRKIIAKRLVEVKNTTAMLTTFNEVDMSAIMAIRAKEKESFPKKHGIKLGFMSFFVKAAVNALKAFPDVNAFIDGDEIVYNDTYNLGIAVSTEKGLMVPVLRSAENMGFADVEKTLKDYAEKARSAKLSVSDLKGGSFTITNGGVFGSLLSTPILNPPQSAILGMHAIVKRPVAIDDKVVIRPMMYLALSYDHRIIDGKEAVSFLVHMKESLEDPSKLLLDF